MEKLWACRVCLATDVFLQPIRQTGLKKTYDNFTGKPVRKFDRLPQYLCNYCCALLIKSYAFMRKCEKSDKLLKCALRETSELTTEYIKSIDREAYELNFPYAIHQIPPLNITHQQPVLLINSQTPSPHNTQQKQLLLVTNEKSTPKIIQPSPNTSPQASLNASSRKPLLYFTPQIPTSNNALQNPSVKTIPLKYSLKTNSLNTSGQIPPSNVQQTSSLNTTQTQSPNSTSQKPYTLAITPIGLATDLALEKEYDNPYLFKVENVDKIASKDTILAKNRSRKSSNTIEELGKPIALKDESVDNESSTGSSLDDTDDSDNDLNASINDEYEVNVDSLAEKEFDMMELSKQEQMQEFLNRKKLDNYRCSRYKCDKCFKGFMKMKHYRDHIVRHDPSSGPELCDICQIRLPDKDGLKNHQAVCHKRRYMCKLCDYTCKNWFSVKEHCTLHSRARASYTCKICGAKFSRAASLDTHEKLLHPPNRRCECGKEFVDLKSLVKHRKTAHGVKMFDAMCSVCSMIFQSKEALDKHTSYSKDGLCDTAQKPCQYCGEGFPTEDILKCHQSVRHSEDTEENCKTIEKLVRRDRSNFGERPLQYSEGPKRLRGSDLKAIEKLMRRERSISGDRRQYSEGQKRRKGSTDSKERTSSKHYSCNYCDRSFSLLHDMEAHVQISHRGRAKRLRNRKN